MASWLQTRAVPEICVARADGATHRVPDTCKAHGARNNECEFVRAGEIVSRPILGITLRTLAG
jgi:hypothetical protein